MSDHSAPPRILITLMGLSPEENGAQATRTISLLNVIQNEFPETYLTMKEGIRSTQDQNYHLIQPLIPLGGRLPLLKEIFFRIQMTLSIIRFIRQKEITSIIIRGYDTILFIPYLKLRNIKIFHDFHGRYDLELIQNNRHLRALFVKICNRIILHYADRILVVSRGTQAQIPEHHHKCLLLQNGVDIRKIEDARNREPVIYLPQNNYVVGFIGNWESFMNIEDICDAVKSRSDITALIIGRGYRFEEVTSRYSACQNIIFTGNINQEQAYATLNQADVCIIPYDKNDTHSRYKNFFSSRKTKEYLALGKPIIVSDTIGREQYLTEGRNCLTYKSRNPEDLARKITILKNNPALAEEMSKNNTELARQFTWKKVIQDSGILSELR